MKTILILILTSCFSMAQDTVTIVPLNTPIDEIPHNAYLKDTYNQLNPFQGTWIYIQGNKKVTLKLEKLINYNSIGNYYKDVIKGRYKVENGSTVIYNDMSELMIAGDISGSNFWQGYYQMSYWDEKECRLLYHVKIKIDPNNSNMLIWEMSSDGLVAFDYDEDCMRKYDADWGTIATLPVNMVLTRQ